MGVSWCPAGAACSVLQFLKVLYVACLVHGSMS